MYTLWCVYYKRGKRFLNYPVSQGSLKHCLRVAGNKDFETVINSTCC